MLNANDQEIFIGSAAVSQLEELMKYTGKIQRTDQTELSNRARCGLELGWDGIHLAIHIRRPQVQSKGTSDTPHWTAKQSYQKQNKNCSTLLWDLWCASNIFPHSSRAFLVRKRFNHWSSPGCWWWMLSCKCHLWGLFDNQCNSENQLRRPRYYQAPHATIVKSWLFIQYNSRVLNRA